MSYRPASAAPSNEFSRASHSSRFSKKGGALPLTASGKHPFGPAINAGPKSRPMSSLNPARTLHDPSTFWDTKMDKSAPFFHNTRVQTCSHIVTKGGKTVAVQFPLEKTGWKAPTSYQNVPKSTEVQSWSQKTYCQQSYQHAGMNKKPLMPYNPNSVRSQLPKPTVVMPYKNSSQIVIGDRSTMDRRQFKTTNRLFQQKPDLDERCTNGGILADKVKWTHKHQVMP